MPDPRQAQQIERQLLDKKRGPTGAREYNFTVGNQLRQQSNIANKILSTTFSHRPTSGNK